MTTNIELRGFNVPHDHPSNFRFGSALNMSDTPCRMPLITLREFTMIRLMNQLTDKPNWHQKVFDDEIANKWKQEALATNGIDITQEMADWCIEELRIKAQIFEKIGMVTAYDADVVKSDGAISEELRVALLNSVKPLEDVSPNEKDWHPGSNGKVLDLVHPSLFPLVYGVSRILPDSVTTPEDCIERCGEGEICNTFDAESYKESWSHRDVCPPRVYSNHFQWLPCDVDISNDRIRIMSYINNLHPQRHKELYSVIERIIDCVIPLWNVTLTRQVSGYRYTRIPFTEATSGVNYPGLFDIEDEDELENRWLEWRNLPAVQPNIGRFTLPPVLASMKAHLDNGGAVSTDSVDDTTTMDLKKKFSENGLQIIVKLANIHLTPEKPEYEGGTWHVEGQLNEHICATALYYYDNENITPSHLAFRQFVDVYDVDYPHIRYEQGYHRWLPDVFGCNPDGPPIQDVGSVETREGRLLTFPNILQHKVQPFKLLDPTKPGHRKILALFLVDPHAKVISTANVPCQRLDWWSECIGKDTLKKLPPELKDEVLKQVDFPMTMDAAREFRSKLMDERREFTLEQTDFLKEISFSLCEH